MLVTIMFPLLSSKHPNMIFSLEKEKGSYLRFSVLKIFEKMGNFQLLFIKKDLLPTSKGLYLKYIKSGLMHYFRISP